MKRVLIDPISSADILYWDAFKGMNMNLIYLLPFKGTLLGFSGEHIQVLGHLHIMTIFGSGENAKGVKVRYLIVNTSFPYNIIIGRPAFNALEAVLSNLYLTLKYPLDDGCVGEIKVNKILQRAKLPSR